MTPLATRPRASPVPGRAHWSTLHNAWHDAMLGCVPHAVGPKEPLPIPVMITIVEHRVRGDPALCDAQAFLDILHRRLAGMRSHVRNAQGRNWDVPTPEVATGCGHGAEVEFRRLVDAMRDQFDLA